MRLEKNLENVIEHDHVALEADLICDCKNNQFMISHSGILKKKLFGGLTLNKKEKQIVIKAKCLDCSKTYILYDSTKDGCVPKGTALSDFEQLTLKDGTCKFQINMKYNYNPEDFKTDKFQMIFIDVKKKDGKEIRLYEE